MAQSTISPTPDSKGLGISFSSRSPPPPPPPSNPSPRNPHRTSTAMHPGHHRPPPPQLQNQTPPRNPRQPPVSLRPSHSNKTSGQGYTSFSAIPPSPHGTAGPRRPHQGQGNYPPRDSGDGSRPQSEKKHSRRGSTASSCTEASKTARRTKSVDILKRFTKEETVSGGRYIPLSGHDDDATSSIGATALSTESLVDPHQRHGRQSTQDATPNSARDHHHQGQNRPSPYEDLRPMPQRFDTSAAKAQQYHHSRTKTPSRASTVSSATTTGTSQDESIRTMSEDEHAIQSHAFPAPPHYPPRSSTSNSDYLERPSSQLKSHPTAYFMPRSLSQPDVVNVPEAHRELGYSAPPVKPGYEQDGKTASGLVTGIHSKNAVLLSAEAGGMMLEFSPSGDGTWKHGDALVPAPVNVPPVEPEHDEEQLKQSSAHPWSAMSSRRPDSRRHTRSQSDGAVLARQGTLFFPTSSTQRASDELGVMLGGRRSRRLSQGKIMMPPEYWGKDEGQGSDKVRLEASKKRKARVEIDVVLEREAVVEGGEIRGRMEVRVTGGKRSAGLRVGGEKIRVVGFEEIDSSSRHIFYHHTHPLPLFAHPPHPSGPKSTLFASTPDEEGFRLAAEGFHAIPFRIRLPMNGGARGSYISPSGKGPNVRYVVVGSVKIHVPASGKRSIAHFYRSIMVLPFLNPAKVLSPSPEPLEARVQKGLGWSLGGEKGKVDIRVALGRRTWVSGQRVWCEVGIYNNSPRRIKTMNLALLQTVQTFTPQPVLDTATPRPIRRRSSTAAGVQDEENDEDDYGADVDACRTSTQRRKLSEEVVEADAPDHGAGRVTGRSWWTGVEPGDAGHWDMSLTIPPGLISIRRTRLMEVVYTLRVTVNGSIYVDVPITLINFLSIDPPPMPNDAQRVVAPMSQAVQQPVKIERLEVNIGQGPYTSRQVEREIMSTATVHQDPPAQASSTTLHIDQLLQNARARAQMDSQMGTATPKERPLSMGSEFTNEQSSTSHLALNTHPARLGPQRTMSYLSTRSGETVESVGTGSGPVSADVHEMDEEEQALLAARRAQGRQRSLAAITRAMDRAAAADEEEVAHAEALHHQQQQQQQQQEDLSSPMEEREYRPLETPDEETFRLAASPSELAHKSTQRTLQQPGTETPRRRRDFSHSISHQQRRSHRKEMTVESDEEDGDSWEDMNNETILEELVSHQSHEMDGMEDGVPHLLGEYGGYDYDEEIEDVDQEVEEGDSQEVPQLQPERTSVHNRQPSGPRQLSKLDTNNQRMSMSRDKHIQSTRSINGSNATSAISTSSEGDSELGEVQEAVKRNMSSTTISRPLPSVGGGDQLDSPISPIKVNIASTFGHSASGSARSICTSTGSMDRRDSRDDGSKSMIPRKASNPSIPSPLRQVEDAASRRGYKGSSSATPTGSPRRMRTPSQSNQGISPRSSTPRHFLNVAPQPIAEPLARMPAEISRPRNLRPSASPTPRDGPNMSTPALARSEEVSDSGSSDGHGLESPPIPYPTGASAGPTPNIRTIEKALDQSSVTTFSELKNSGQGSPTWQPGEHMLRQQVHHVQTAGILPNALDLASFSPRSDDHSTASSHETHQSGHSNQSNLSILPSVKSKIAALEFRDEALRKFTVASASSNNSALTAMAPLPVPNQAARSSPRGSPSGRKSYTAALASRPVRSISDDTNQHTTGGVDGYTYLRPKIVNRDAMKSIYGSPPRFDPFGTTHNGSAGSGVARHHSQSSVSTSATAIEAALARKKSTAVQSQIPQIWAGREYTQTDYDDGADGAEEGSGMERGWSRMTEGTDESEGLL